jgi:hypothetical protein
MAKPTDRNSFPWWYTWVKWMLPIGLAALASAIAGLTLAGIIPAFGVFKGAAAFFASLEGFSSFAVLSLTIVGVASFIGLATSLFVRTGLFNVAENIATANQEHAHNLEEQMKELKVRMDEEAIEFDRALKEETTQKEKMSEKYYILQGKVSSTPSKPVPVMKKGAHTVAANEEELATSKGQRKNTVHKRREV